MLFKQSQQHISAIVRQSCVVLLEELRMKSTEVTKHKICTCCKKEKIISEFYSRGSSHYSICKICKKSQRRIIYQTHTASNINNLVQRFIRVADIVFENELSKLTDISMLLERKIQSWQSRTETIAL